MKTAKFTTFTYDIVDEINLGQIEKVASLQFNLDPSEISIPSTIEMQELAPDQVALQLYHPHTGIIKKYACYDAELTNLNAQLFLEKADNLPDEIVKTAAFFLKRAARNQGLSSELIQQLSKVASASVPSDNVVNLDNINEYAYFKKIDSGHEKTASTMTWALPHKKRYPIDTAEEIEKAAAYFDDYCNQFETADRLVYAMNVLEAASREGVEVKSGTIEKYAHLTANSFNNNFTQHINMRKKYLTDPEESDIYDELLDKCASLGVITSARTLEAIDRHYGLDRLWNTYIADPVVSTCGINKEAEVEIDGYYVTQSNLNKLTKKDISHWVDEDTKKELMGPEGLDVLRSLPEPTREGLLAELE